MYCLLVVVASSNAELVLRKNKHHVSRKTDADKVGPDIFMFRKSCYLLNHRILVILYRNLEPALPKAYVSNNNLHLLRIDV